MGKIVNVPIPSRLKQGLTLQKATNPGPRGGRSDATSDQLRVLVSEAQTTKGRNARARRTARG